MKKKNGFTLMELLAVIVILAILVGLGSFVAIKAINSSRRKAAEIREDSLRDAAITYAIDSNLNLSTCPVGFSPDNYNNFSAINCYAVVTVQFLKVNDFFDDPKNGCLNTGEVLIYAREAFIEDGNEEQTYKYDDDMYGIKFLTDNICLPKGD